MTASAYVTYPRGCLHGSLVSVAVCVGAPCRCTLQEWHSLDRRLRKQQLEGDGSLWEASLRAGLHFSALNASQF